MSGVRNVYSQIIVFMSFLACCGCFGIHVYFAEKNQEINNPDDLANTTPPEDKTEQSAMKREIIFSVPIEHYQPPKDIVY